MKVLLTGAGGQLGRCVQEVFASSQHQLFSFTRRELDVSDFDAVSKCIRRLAPDVIINAAAYTAVDRAEEQAALAAAINVQGPEHLARVAAEIGSWLIHVSTDYVFDGNFSRPILETDPVHPRSVYGETKLEGERRIQKCCDKYLILRTAWVFSEYGSNFVKTMLRLGRERNRVSVVNDQIGSPTYAGDIALASLAVVDCLQKGRGFEPGIYHLAGGGAVSWYAFAKYIFQVATELDYLDAETQVDPIATSEYPTAAERPAYSVLSTEKFENAFDFHVGDWQERVVQVVRTLQGLKNES